MRIFGVDPGTTESGWVLLSAGRVENSGVSPNYDLLRWVQAGQDADMLAIEMIAGMGMTEPGAGTDVLGMTTTAVRSGDHFIVNGTKTYITNGTRADFVTLLAKTRPEIAPPPAIRSTFRAGVPQVYLPGFHVGAQLRLSLPEMERWVKGRGAIGDHLFELYTHNPLWALQGISSFEAHSWVIWDLINIAWLIEPAWVPSEIVRTPWLMPDKRWRADASRHPMREAHGVQRDAIFLDFFRKLPY